MKRFYFRLIPVLVIVLFVTLMAGISSDGGIVTLFEKRNALLLLRPTTAITADTGIAVKGGDTAITIGGTFRAIDVCFRCIKISNADSTFMWLKLRNRFGERGSWQNVCSSSFMAAGEVWYHFLPYEAYADTTKALGSHWGQDWRVDWILGDSTSDVTAYTDTMSFEVLLKLTK